MNCILTIPPRHLEAQTAFIMAHPWDLRDFLNLLSLKFQKVPLATARLYINRHLIVVGPCLGRPQLFIILEHLYAWGVRQFIFIGWCGAINAKLSIGDLVIPTPFNQKWVDLILSYTKLPFHCGKVWSIDNPYELTRQDCEQLNQQGILAVDMETQGLALWTTRHNCESTALLLVSDLLYTPQWRPGFSDTHFKNARHSLLKGLTAFLKTGLGIVNRGQ